MELLRNIKKQNTIQRVHHYYKRISYTIKNAYVIFNFRTNNSSSITERQFKEYNLERIDGPQTLICNAPFNSIYINISGDVTVCGYNKTFVLGNLRNTTLQNIWNNQEHLKLQKHIQSYNLEYGCQVCKHKIVNKDYHRAAIYYDTPKYDYTNHLRKITFELSNLCNLECIMCNGELSSLIRKNRDKKEPLQLVEYNNLINDLIPFIPNLTFTQFLGGEPLLIKIYYEIWNKIIELNKNCIISLQTNGMVLPKKFISLLKSKQFNIGISIDSFKKEKFETIRKNTKFETVFENFYTLLEIKKQDKIELSINFVPININWDEIPDALNFANKNEIILSMCELDFPYEYSFKSMDSNSLNKILEYLDNIKIDTHNNSTSIQNYKTYYDHISLLKNLYLNVKNAEKNYPITQDTFSINIEHAKSNFYKALDIFPLAYDSIKQIVENDFLNKIDKYNNVKKINAYQYFNQYIELSKTLYINEVKEINTNQKSILLSELSNVFNTILNKLELIND